MSAKTMPAKTVTLSGLRREWLLGVAFATTALFLLFGKGWLADLSNPLWFALMLVWLFAVIMASAFAVVHHAESLAMRLGEPLGTLVLTLSVIGIEVMMISAVMLTGEGKPALARDAMFGVVMIVLNGMIGISLLLGGLRHHEQAYNLQGANSFLSLIVPLTVLGLVLPNFTNASRRPYAISLSVRLPRGDVDRDLWSLSDHPELEASRIFRQADGGPGHQCNSDRATAKQIRLRIMGSCW